MEPPKRIKPRTPADYFEVMTRAVFQSGISWRVVDAKWEALRRKLGGFDPVRVAAMGQRDVDRLADDPALIRNRRKIEATIANAQTMLDIAQEHGSFRRYLRSFGAFEPASADLKKRFKFIGDLGAYYFLWTVSEPVPPYEQWRKAKGRTPATARRPAATRVPRAAPAAPPSGRR